MNPHRTLPALAVAAALTVAAAPASQAQSVAGESSASLMGVAADIATKAVAENLPTGLQSSEVRATADTAADTTAAASEKAENTENTEKAETAEKTETAEKKTLGTWSAGAVAGELEGVAWYYHADGKHVVADKAKIAANAEELAALGEGAMTIEAFAEQAGYEKPDNGTQQTSTGSSALLGDAAGGAGGLDAVLKLIAGSSSLPMLPFAAVGEKAGEIGGVEWFYNKDFNFVVNSKDMVNEAVRPGQAGVMLTIDFARQLQRSLPINIVLEQQGSSQASAAQIAALAQGSSANASGGISGGSSAGDAVRIAAIALPALLLVGGITYYLNNDGRTYMSSAQRTSSAPTSEEYAFSRDLLSSNRAEVQRQAQAEGRDEGAIHVEHQADTAADYVRGIGAETGSNDVARALVALIIASLVGAAVFFFGRKQLL